MEIKIVDYKGDHIAIIESDEVVINNLEDSLDIIGNCDYQGSSKLIIKKEQIIPEFFDLKTGIAGEILQKFSTYQKQLAIVGDFSEITSKSLRDFIYESNKMGRICFVGSLEEAKEKLLISL